tara:strand:+ start:331 stop:591 length:261 start_codon:yes stop_codon:yes gene_type:complete
MDKQTLFAIGVQLTIMKLEKDACSKYGLSTGKLWYALSQIIDKGVEWNIEGFRNGNALDTLFASMGPNIAALAKATDEAERINPQP